MSNTNKRGIRLLSAMDYQGMILPLGTEIDFEDDEFEAALVSSGSAEWLKGAVPDSITIEQAQAALKKSRMKSTFDQFMSRNPAYAMLFKNATDIRRSSPLIEELRLNSGRSQADMDDLFRMAEGL